MRRFLLAGLIACVTAAVACGSSDEPTTGATVTEDDAAVETARSEDTEAPGYCVGLEAEPGASVFDDQCEGITECTAMEPPAGAGSCWCGICAPRRSRTVCIAVHCRTPGQPDRDTTP